MAIEHTLRDFDTVRSLAMEYNVPWQAIVDYNKLNYPYILDSKEEYERLYAHGYLTFTRELFNSNLIIYAGSEFATGIDDQGIRKIYTVVEDTTIPAGQAVGYLPVRCIHFGTFGNTIEDTITEPYRLRTSLGEFLSAITVTNEQPITNGSDITVKYTGQSIYIPTSESEEQVETVSDTDTFFRLIGGEDLVLDADGDLMDDGFGDMGTVVGLNNMRQTVKHILMTERGSLAQHPQYGTRLHTLIGQAQLPYIHKLVELDIEESLSYVDFINQVSIDHIEINGTSVYVELNAQISTRSERFSLQLNLD